VSCVAPRGAFYAFPRIDIPEGDDIFCKELLLQKHVLTVHGSGFGQRPGTKHFRIVFLPNEQILGQAYAAVGDFLSERYG
jgi:alanine-synthesizing transaminase